VSIETEVLIVGTGFAGLGTAIRFAQQGRRDFTVIERADDVGGTWRDNTYPGLICDVPSHLYSFSFAPNPDWTRTYPGQAEILRYLRGCAERHGVRQRIRFGTELRSARWDGVASRWRVETTVGSFSAHFLVLGVGAFSAPQMPVVPGLETFAGTLFHSAQWRHDHDLRGERVAVIGTGASAIQFVPEIQPVVGHLDLYQRTAPWVMRRRDRAISGSERRLYRAAPAVQLLVRAAIYWARECFFLGFRRAPWLLRLGQRLATRQLRAQVPDPALRARLTPSYAMGCKRVLLSNDYYPALAQPNVDVISGGITRVTARGVVDAAGVERPADVIIFGTGFHATEPPQIDVLRGRRGVTLRQAWAAGMSAFKGTTVNGFPNLFVLVGPNTGLGHNSMVYMIESQVAYVIEALAHLRSQGLGVIEVREEAERAWNERVQVAMHGTVWMTGGCASWYLDASGRNTTLWPGFSFEFRRELRRFDAASYRIAPAHQVEPAPAPAVAV
jgi:cation diffusion facilitator CzcD-associated flavoprotein CzcO